MSKKAIFVDGPSLFHICRVLKIGKYDFQNLMRVFTDEAGDCREVASAVYVSPKERINGIRYKLRRAGFEPIAVATENEEDDRFISKSIAGLGNDVSEIILASADSGYKDVLIDKQNKGVRVFVVATEAVDLQSRRPLVSTDMVEQFEFIELGNFRDRIMLQEWEDRALSGVAGESGRTNLFRDDASDKNFSFRAELEINDEPEKVGQVLAALIVLAERFSIKLSFSGNNKGASP